ncbi:hypothetical protein GCM10017667_67930 [Streptomyces filamentosus]|uniref:Uncharacterized protein n=1 Tax=Streptomyces filamentosus TaxID=67294 RepID=A0A919EST4_STRFL|nr:hypothetical protein GCM10017667_67930 [Streptomyces filamentosus]
MFSDPVPRWRRTEHGHVIQTRGHLGIVYQALSATYTGLGTARTLTVLPDGSTFTSGVRAGSPAPVWASEAAFQQAGRALGGVHTLV